MRVVWGITRSLTATTPSFVPEHQTPADVPSPSSSQPAIWTRTTRVRTTTSIVNVLATVSWLPILR